MGFKTLGILTLMQPNTKLLLVVVLEVVCKNNCMSVVAYTLLSYYDPGPPQDTVGPQHIAKRMGSRTSCHFVKDAVDGHEYLSLARRSKSDLVQR